MLETVCENNLFSVLELGSYFRAARYTARLHFAHPMKAIVLSLIVLLTFTSLRAQQPNAWLKDGKPIASTDIKKVELKLTTSFKVPQ